MDKFKISPNWDCILSFDDLVANAKFVFSNDGHEGKKPRIVLKEAVNEIDCIEIDYDREGLITNGETRFNNEWGNIIVDVSKNVIEFIKGFLESEGADDLIIEQNK